MKIAEYVVRVEAEGDWSEDRIDSFVQNQAPALKEQLKSAGKQFELVGNLKVEVSMAADQVFFLHGEWRILFGNRVLTPTWQMKGPAEACLSMLRTGVMQPTPSGGVKYLPPRERRKDG